MIALCLCPYAFSHSVPIHCSTYPILRLMPVSLCLQPQCSHTLQYIPHFAGDKAYVPPYAFSNIAVHAFIKLLIRLMPVSLYLQHSVPIHCSTYPILRLMPVSLCLQPQHSHTLQYIPHFAGDKAYVPLYAFSNIAVHAFIKLLIRLMPVSLCLQHSVPIHCSTYLCLYALRHSTPTHAQIHGYTSHAPPQTPRPWTTRR